MNLECPNDAIREILHDFEEGTLYKYIYTIYIYILLASETLTGVTQSKIGDVSLLASERSERDSIRGG